MYCSTCCHFASFKIHVCDVLQSSVPQYRCVPAVTLLVSRYMYVMCCRAVYRSTDVYLLDDPLSAVDTHVGKHLFEDCVSSFLANKTRILVTHQLQYLRDADHIVILNNVSIKLLAEAIVNVKGKPWKGEKTKSNMKRGEKSNTYLTHVCILLQNVESLERMEKNGSFSKCWLSTAVLDFCRLPKKE